jgi:aspartate 1-decarboxylase
MQRHLMKSKIHRATITSADLHYEVSLTAERHLPAIVFVDSKNRIIRPQLRAES